MPLDASSVDISVWDSKKGQEGAKANGKSQREVMPGLAPWTRHCMHTLGRNERFLVAVLKQHIQEPLTGKNVLRSTQGIPFIFLADIVLPANPTSRGDHFGI
jgi:hypothetical protein